MILDDAPLKTEAPKPPSSGPGVTTPTQLVKSSTSATLLRRELAAGDLLVLSAAWGTEAVAGGSGWAGRQLAFSTLAVLVTLLDMGRVGLYRSRVCALHSLEAVRVTEASIFGAGCFLALEALFAHVDVASAVITGAAGVVAVLFLRWHFVRRLKARRSASRSLRTIVMIGTNEDAEQLWTLLKEEPELGYRVGGIVGEQRADAPWRDLPHCAGAGQMGELAARSGANGVIVVASALGPSERMKAVDEALAAGLHAQVWPGLYGLSSRRTRMTPMSGVPLLYVEPRRATRWGFGAKRLMDLLLASLLCVLNAPLVAAAALAIKLTDGGPVIYRSQRVGRYGKTISVFKLRTMVRDAANIDVESLNERRGGPLFKASDDPRVTKVGRFLRETSIDEIPQLWNVLNGTMSLVGPRPALLDEVLHFDAELCRRHQMRPGITGLWQVEARDNPSFSAYRRYDLSYVDDWALGLDVAILASTAHELVVRGLRFGVQAVTRRQARPVTPALTPQTLSPRNELAGREVF